MNTIKELSKMIEEELKGAEDYVKNALKYRIDNPSIANTYYEISLQEMTHVDMLHNEVVNLIQQYRRDHGEPPAAMKAVYDYMHERQIEEANEIKMYQQQYRES